MAFKNGFDLGYRGDENVRLTAPNLKFVIGDEVELWNKVMTEVELKRYAGLFEKIPFDNFIQSPIGLVPKDGGAKTRLIFHLSYPRNTKKGRKLSVNANTPRTFTTVKYPDFTQAIMMCLACGVGCAVAKSDLHSAFRNLGIAKRYWKYLVMKARNPLDGKFYYFVDKCLPFGAAISCALFQQFSNALAHIVKVRTQSDLINYLDDFFFAAIKNFLCNMHVREFLQVCESVRFPVSLEKTVWSTTRLVFLGLLIDTVSQVISLPKEKIEKTIQLLLFLLTPTKRKTTVLMIQKVCGLLNFVSLAVIPGRAFTRRLYSLTRGTKLRPNHHVRLTRVIKGRFVHVGSVSC